MAVWVALLRAVNVGGRWMKMTELVALCDGLGLTNARTYLQSGNLLFTAKGSRAAIAAKLEAAIEKTFGYRSEAILRSAGELAELAGKNPFPKMAKDDPAHLLVNFLAGAPTAEDKAALAVKWDGPETWKLVGSELFICYAAGIGPSKLKLKLKTRATGRNWKVVTALARLAAEAGE
jgi:uncharacterized protein (DUF1697 family)